MRLTWLCAAAVPLLLAACAESPPTQPSTLVPTLAIGPAPEAQINRLINTLFPPREKGAWFSAFARVKHAVASGDDDLAHTVAMDFIRTLLEAHSGVLPPGTATALRDLVNMVATFVGLPAPLQGANPFAGDGAVAVVGTAGGQVIASSGFGGVTIPAGALPGEVILVIERLPNGSTPGAGPLPTSLRQLPLYYRVSSVPEVSHLAVPVTVGICQLEVGEPFGPATQAEANRLQLALPDAGDPSGVMLLPRVAAPFLDCDGVTLTAASFESGDRSTVGKALEMVRQGGVGLLGLFRPSAAHAIHGGLGGTTSAFGPFGAVVPGGIVPEHGILAVGVEHGCLLDLSGTTSCWGLQPYTGTGGPPDFLSVLPRTPVAGSPSFTSVVTNGGSYTCGRTPGGGDMCWGRDPAIALPTVPTALGHGPYLQVSPGNLLACALTPSNSAVCWGNNGAGQLGNGTSGVSSTTPVAVATALTFEVVQAGWIHACALTFAGEVHCWGDWQGISSAVPPDLTPVPVPGGLVFSRLYAGWTHTCGITDTDETWCWGDNASGQLGSGAADVGGGTPVRVVGGHAFVMIATGRGFSANGVGAGHTCGLTHQGQVLCWGLNDEGQLGNGSTTNTLDPTPISSTEVFVAIGGSGAKSACAVTIDRRVFCWGRNSQGQLGSGVAGGFSSVPVLVP
ncbi:MAG: RCC1 domain-containing protein [Gemmatimonadales bacterium]